MAVVPAQEELLQTPGNHTYFIHASGSTPVVSLVDKQLGHYSGLHQAAGVVVSGRVLQASVRPHA